MKDYKDEIETRQLQEDPIRQIIRKADREGTVLDGCSWPLTSDREVNEYLRMAAGLHTGDIGLDSMNSALSMYPMRFDDVFQAGMDVYREQLQLYLERQTVKEHKDPNRELDRPRMEDKYIPHTIEAGMDHYLSSDEEIEEMYER